VGDKLTRAERDRLLFDTNPRRRLTEMLAKANPHVVSGVIVRSLELQIAIEEYARAAGLDVSPAAIGEYVEANRTEVEAQVNGAISSFIGSILSQEG
jgi:hypothetical protein